MNLPQRKKLRIPRPDPKTKRRGITEYAPGDLIASKYRLTAIIGEGGMAAVWRACNLSLESDVAVKLIRTEVASDELVQRLGREARATAKLRHPNIAALYDCSITSNGTAYMVMEYISGMNLYQFLAADLSLDVDEVRSLSAQVLDALEYLHDRDIIHRDISTDNLMLTEDDKGRRTIKLIDLGLAKSLDHTDFKTRTGVLIGQMTYVSPEQLNEGSDALDGRSDLYSFAIVLYQLLTREVPIVGQDQMSLMAGHLHHPPKSFDETDPDSDDDWGYR